MNQGIAAFGRDATGCRRGQWGGDFAGLVGVRSVVQPDREDTVGVVRVQQRHRVEGVGGPGRRVPVGLVEHGDGVGRSGHLGHRRALDQPDAGVAAVDGEARDPHAAPPNP